MAKLDRVQAKVFASTAEADEIGQFGSAVEGSKLNTSDVATIQALDSWLDGFSKALVSGNRYAALQEVNGALKVLSYQGAYALQEGIAEYNADTTYYIGSIVKKTGTFDIYGSLTDDNVGNALVEGADWKFLVDLSNLPNTLVFTADTSNMPTLSNNAIDADHDIDFTTGFCWDDTLSVKMEANSSFTKRFDATFAEGTGNGGFASGESLPTSGTIHIWMISKADGTVDYFANNHATSGLAPTLPTGFVYKRRLGSRRTDSSANILGFNQYSDFVKYKSRILDRSRASIPTSRTLVTLSVPTGLNGIIAVVEGIYYSGSGAVYTIMQSPLETDVAATIDNLNLTAFDTAGESGYQMDILCNSSSQIAIRSNSTNAFVGILTVGYYDRRLN